MLGVVYWKDILKMLYGGQFSGGGGVDVCLGVWMNWIEIGLIEFVLIAFINLFSAHEPHYYLKQLHIHQKYI